MHLDGQPAGSLTPEHLRTILENHSEWLRQGRLVFGQGRARKAILRRANLAGADLTGADLTGADLVGVELQDTNLDRANLAGADLRFADLRRAYLTRADLKGTDLTGASLTGVSLTGANLTGAKGLETFRICPQIGAFRAFKKVYSGKVGCVLLDLEIPPNATRLNKPGSRKCRASHARVVRFRRIDKDGSLTDFIPEPGTLRSMHSSDFAYPTELNALVVPASFDNDLREECAAGIHFFITEEEAVAY